MKKIDRKVGSRGEAPEELASIAKAIKLTLDLAIVAVPRGGAANCKDECVFGQYVGTFGEICHYFNCHCEELWHYVFKLVDIKTYFKETNDDESKKCKGCTCNNKKTKAGSKAKKRKSCP